MAVVVDENMGRSLQHPGAILHQALRVIDHRVIYPIGTAPASIQVLVRQTVPIAAGNTKTPRVDSKTTKEKSTLSRIKETGHQF